MNIKIGDKVEVTEIIRRTVKGKRELEVVTTDGAKLAPDKSNAATVTHTVEIQEMSLIGNRVVGKDEKGGVHVWDWRSAQKLTPKV